MANGSSVFSPSLKAAVGAGRGYDGVYISECGHEFIGQNSPHLLSLLVIRIVVARAERIRSKQNASLDLGAKAFFSGGGGGGESLYIELRLVALAERWP